MWKTFVALIIILPFSAIADYSRDDEGCHFVARQMGGTCESGWVYVTKTDELRGTKIYNAMVFEQKTVLNESNAVLSVSSENNKKMSVASLKLANDIFTCDIKHNNYCAGLIRVNDGEIYQFSYFTLDGADNIIYFKPGLLKAARKIVIEISTSSQKKRQLLFLTGNIKWTS